MLERVLPDWHHTTALAVCKSIGVRQFTCSDAEVATFTDAAFDVEQLPVGTLVVELLGSVLELEVVHMLVWCLPQQLLQRPEDLQSRLM